MVMPGDNVNMEVRTYHSIAMEEDYVLLFVKVWHTVGRMLLPRLRIAYPLDRGQEWRVCKEDRVARRIRIRLKAFDLVLD